MKVTSRAGLCTAKKLVSVSNCLNISLLASSIACAVSAMAAQEEIQEVQVWGTQVRASSVNLESETIAIRQADHISDLLRTIPGVDVGGAHSLNQRITIRSMDDKDLRIRIDGANQNTYMYHHMGNLQIHADILESVDVEVGTNSVVNGGLGGSVDFETKSASQLLKEGEQFGARLQATYGNNSGSSLAFTGFGQLTETLDIIAYYNTLQRDNYDVGGGDILDANGALVAGTDGTVRGLEGDLDDALIKFGWDFAENQRIELGYEAYTDEGEYSYRPDMGLATDLAITNSLGVPLLWPTEFTRDTLSLNYTVDWGSNSSLRASLFSNESTLDRDERGWAASAPFAASAGLISGTAENSGLNVLIETEADQHLFTYGAEIIDYDTTYEAAYASSTDRSDESANSLGFFVQDRIQLLDDLVLIPGVRYDSFDLGSAVVDQTFSDYTLGLAAEFEAAHNVLIKLSFTEIFKAPEIGEVFVGAGLYDTANAGIVAEDGINKELSVAFEDEVFGADNFIAGFTIFQTDIDNYIYDYATPPPSVGGRSWKDNIGDMDVDGVEAYVGYELGNFTSLLTWSDAESELDAFPGYPSLQGARLDRQQGDTLSINVDYSFDELNLSLHWDLLSVDGVEAGINLDGATLDNSKDSYTVHNVSARWRPEQVEGLALIFGVDNLFDEYYASQSSRTGVSFHPRFGPLYLLDYEPGRNIKVTASFEF